MKILKFTRSPVGDNGTTITRKVDTTAIGVTTATTDTVIKIRIRNLVTTGNTRRGIPRSPLYKNHPILYWQNSENHSLNSLT